MSPDATPPPESGRDVVAIARHVRQRARRAVSRARQLTYRAALAIAESQKRRLEEDTRTLERALAEVDLLNAIARAAAGENDLDKILGAALHGLASTVPFTGGTISLIEGDRLVIKAARGPFAAEALGMSLRRGEGRVWRAIETGTGLIVPDVVAAGLQPTTPIRAFMPVPLIWHGRTNGVFTLDSTKPGAFSSADLALATKVAQALAGPVEIARLYGDAVREIEERRLLEVALRESEARFYRLAENAPDIIARVDMVPQRRVSYVNRSVLEKLGYAPEEFYANQDLGDQMVHPEDLEKLIALSPEPVRFVTKDGRILWFELRFAPVQDGEGQLLSYEVVARDVTRRREAEERERRALEQMAQQAETVARLEERERIAMDLHDGAIQSLYSVMLQIEGSALKAATERERAAWRAVSAQVQDVVGELRRHIMVGLPTPSEVDVREALAEIVENARAGAPVDITIDVESGPLVLPAATADDLLYVAREALSNALRHSGADSIMVSLTASPEAVELRISDDGAGFEPDSRPACRPKAPSSSSDGDVPADLATPDGEGKRRRRQASPVGRGLANMRRRARRLGGSLAVSRPQDGGTEVRLTVPRVQVPAADQAG